MTAGDDTVDRAADKLEETAQRAADQGGLAGKLAQPLADDAAFLRKLKPSLIRARVRGELPTGQPPTSAAQVAPSGPQLSPRGAKQGLNPFAVLGGAVAAGVLFARLVDWRSHAHPRR